MRAPDVKIRLVAQLETEQIAAYDLFAELRDLETRVRRVVERYTEVPFRGCE